MILNFLIEHFYFIFFIVLLVYNYMLIQHKFFLLRALNVLTIIDLIFCILNEIFIVGECYYYTIQSFFMFFFLYSKLFSYIESDEINDNNVCLIFYKPKKLKQFLLSIFGLSYSSAGLVINRNIYQMRYEAETLQEIPFKEGTEEYLKEKYLIVDTGFKWKNLKGDWKNNLLSQPVRQNKTWNLRFNCLRSLRFVLNQIPNFEYKFEYFFPCFYLYELKIKGIINGRKKNK